MALTTRSNKGTPLTHAEMDANLEGLADGSLITDLASSKVEFTQSGSGAVADTVSKVLQRKKSVFDYMTNAQRADVLAYTYGEDVTTALQAAIDDVIGTGGNLEWPDGGYKITDELDIPLSTGWNMYGQSRLGTIIKQYTDNTRIFRFVAADTHSWTLKTFRLDYANAQPAANTAAIPISFMADTGTPGTGVYNFELGDLHIQRGWYGISGNPSVALTVWGGDINNIWFSQELSGGAIRLTQSVATGQPNNKLRSIYVRADDCENTIFDLQACHTTEMDNIEVVNVTNGVRVLGAASNSTISVGEMKVENGNWTTANMAIFDTSSSYVSFRRLQLGGSSAVIDAGAGSSLRLFNISSGGYLHIDYLQIANTVSVASGTFFLFNTAAVVKVDFIEATNLPTNCYLTNIPSATSTELVNVESWNRPGVNADAGDADTTITIGTTKKVIRYNTTLTATRSVNLPTPNANGNMFNGLSYIVIRTGLGNFRLDVKHGGTTVFSFPPNTGGVCEVLYYRIGTFTWTVARKWLDNSVSADNGNAAATLTVGQSSFTQVWNTAITADRAVTLSTTGAKNGDKFRIVRTANATGAFNLNVGTGPLKAMGTAGSYCEVEYDGSAWVLTAYGTL